MAEASGAYADAARSREQQLAQRLAVAVRADQIFAAALRDVHQRNLYARRRLDAIDSEIRQAAATWPGLNTPAGDREFSRFLTGKTREIQKIVADGAADSRRTAGVIQSLTGHYTIADDLPRPGPRDGDRPDYIGGDYRLQDGSTPPAGQYGFPGDPNIPPPHDSLPGGGRWDVDGDGCPSAPGGGPPVQPPEKGRPWKMEPRSQGVKEGRGSGWVPIGTVPPNGWGEDPVIVGQEAYTFRWVGESFNPDAPGHVQWVQKDDGNWYRARWIDYQFEQEHRRQIGAPGAPNAPSMGANQWKPISIQDIYKVHNYSPNVAINIPDLCGQQITIPPRP